jgi:hypothetical protein
MTTAEAQGEQEKAAAEAIIAATPNFTGSIVFISNLVRITPATLQCGSSSISVLD